MNKTAKAQVIDLKPGDRVLTPTNRLAVVVVCGGDRPLLRYLDTAGGSVVLQAELLRPAEEEPR
jgi:hypothetical protein